MDKIRKEIIEQVFKNCKKRNIRAIVLFGSRARGDHRKNSDYDINVFLKRNIKKHKIPSYNFDEEIFINYVSPKEFRYQRESMHSFLYCTFRDGIPIYQEKRWFDKNKSSVLKLKPSKKTAINYIKRSAEGFFNIKRFNFSNTLLYEDAKVCSNQLGFGILMNNQIYPISPHTLKRELINLNKKYKSLAQKIEYLQEIYYNNRHPKIKNFKSSVKKLEKVSIGYLKKYSLKNYKEVIKFNSL